jgi:hypothetical protein
MTIEVTENEPWTTNYLVDRLKQHLATFETSITSSDNEKVYDYRKYYQQAHQSLFFGALKPVPDYLLIIYEIEEKFYSYTYQEC